MHMWKCRHGTHHKAFFCRIAGPLPPMNVNSGSPWLGKSSCSPSTRSPFECPPSVLTMPRVISPLGIAVHPRKEDLGIRTSGRKEGHSEAKYGRQRAQQRKAKNGLIWGLGLARWEIQTQDIDDIPGGKEELGTLGVNLQRKNMPRPRNDASVGSDIRVRHTQSQLFSSWTNFQIKHIDPSNFQTV